MSSRSILLSRRLGEWFSSPLTQLRQTVRASELWLIAVAAIVGAGSGLLVTAMSWIAQAMHQTIFGLDPGDRLSSVSNLPPMVAFLAPVCGGLVLGVILIGLERWRRRPAIDPIEANARHGGRLSVR